MNFISMYTAESRRKSEAPRRAGQALVELMVALSVLVIGLLGIISLLSRSLNINRVVSDNNVATYLAAEGIEVTKNLIDANILRGDAWDCGLGNNDHALSYSSFPPGASCPGQGLKVANSQNQVIYFDATTNRYMDGQSNPPAATRTPFTRIVRLSGVGTDRITVRSIVSWSSGAGANQVDLEDQFTNWRP